MLSDLEHYYSTTVQAAMNPRSIVEHIIIIRLAITHFLVRITLNSQQSQACFDRYVIMN